jgi:hypothetical protein
MALSFAVGAVNNELVSFSNGHELIPARSRLPQICANLELIPKSNSKLLDSAKVMVLNRLREPYQHRV